MWLRKVAATIVKTIGNGIRKIKEAVSKTIPFLNEEFSSREDEYWESVDDLVDKVEQVLTLVIGPAARLLVLVLRALIRYLKEGATDDERRGSRADPAMPGV